MIHRIMQVSLIPFILFGTCLPLNAQEDPNLGVFTAAVDWEGSSDAHATGGVEFIDDRYTLFGNGDDIGGTEDEGFFVYTEKTGDGSISGNIVWEDPGFSEWSKVGFMIRENAENPQSKYYAVILLGRNFGELTQVQIRVDDGESTATMEIKDPFGNTVAADPAVGIWYRISRIVQNDLFVFEYSYDGIDWTIGHSATVEMANTAAFGAAIANGADNEEFAIASISDVQIGAPSFILAERSISSGVFIGQATLDVSVRIYNTGAQQRVNIEDIVPLGWTVSNISNNGEENSGIIRWDYNAPSGESFLTYTVISPEDPTESGAWTGTIGNSPITGMRDVLLLFDEILAQKINAPMLSNQVELDGQIGPNEYSGAATVQFNGSDQNPPGVWTEGGPISPDLSNVRLHVFHNHQYIYVAVDVADIVLEFGNESNVSLHDSIALYVDGNLSRSEQREGNRFGAEMIVMGDGSRADGDDAPQQIETLANGGHRSEGGSYWNFAASAKPGRDGYVVEYRLEKEKMVESDARNTIGFDILVNGSNEPGTAVREYQYGWFMMKANGEIAAYDNDESGWGLLELLQGDTSVRDWSIR